MKLKSIRHTGVPVRDVEKGGTSYGDILGFSEIPRSEVPRVPGIWYECNGTQIHIIGQRNEKAAKGLPAFGPHIAVQVEDIVEAKRGLTANGIEFSESTAPPQFGGGQCCL